MIPGSWTQNYKKNIEIKNDTKKYLQEQISKLPVFPQKLLQLETYFVSII